MLRVNTPELLLFNPSLVEGLFDSIWSDWLKDQLLAARWQAYRGDFFLDSQFIFYETFSRCIEEVVSAANLRRPLDFEYVTFDYSAYMDSYNYEGDGSLTIDQEEELEKKIFEFFDFVINKLICKHFLDAATQRLTPSWESLSGMVGAYGIVGFWYESCVGQMKMWEGKDHVWALQPDDYEAIIYSPWDGARIGTEFYQLSLGDGNEFYLFNGALIQEGSCDLIPKGEMVTMCRLSEAAQTTMDL